MKTPFGSDKFRALVRDENATDEQIVIQHIADTLEPMVGSPTRAEDFATAIALALHDLFNGQFKDIFDLDPEDFDLDDEE